jgi:hypothetical protein
MDQEETKIAFHPDAVARFAELAQAQLKSVKSFGGVETISIPQMEIHPVATITSDEINGEIKVVQSAFNGLGEEQGRYWTSKGLRVGWEGSDFEAIKDLASKMANASPIKGLVSTKFVLDEVFRWLKETLEVERRDALPDHIADCCSKAIKDYEIWVPVYRTYSGNEFDIGQVRFRTVSKALLDQSYKRIPEDIAKRPEVAVGINRKRARIQASLAACTQMRAEISRAREMAQFAAIEAINLLRFLSPANWTCKIVSHCLPVGQENTRQTMELLFTDGAISNMIEEVIEDGPAGWNVDEARQPFTGLLEALHQLALRKESTEFKRDLYKTFQLHSRNSVAIEVPHKILFVTAAIESLLLRSSHEPIQKNLGERMAFISGNSLEERKEIVKNVEDFYEIRSQIFHHGNSVSPGDVDIIEKFFLNVWFSLARLLERVDQYETKNKLLSALEDRKLS